MVTEPTTLFSRCIGPLYRPEVFTSNLIFLIIRPNVLADEAKVTNLGLSEDETLVVQLPGTSHILLLLAVSHTGYSRR